MAWEVDGDLDGAIRELDVDGSRGEEVFADERQQGLRQFVVSVIVSQECGINCADEFRL